MSSDNVIPFPTRPQTRRDIANDLLKSLGYAPLPDRSKDTDEDTEET